MQTFRPARVAALALVPTLLLGALAAPARAERGPRPGDPAPELKVKGWARGGPVKAEDLRGRVVVLVFFGTHVPDFEAAVPRFNDLKKHHGDALVVVAISREPAAKAKAWAEARTGDKVPEFAIAEDGTAWDDFGIGGYPHAYVIDVHGEVRWRGEGLDLASISSQTGAAVKERKVVARPKDVSAKVAKAFDAADKGDFRTAIRLLAELEKKGDEKEKADAAKGLADIDALAEARVERADLLAVRRRDYLQAEAILKSVEKAFEGRAAGAKAAATLKDWKKRKDVQEEMQAAKAFAEARRLEDAKDFRGCGELLRAIQAKWPATKAAEDAKARLEELKKAGKPV